VVIYGATKGVIVIKTYQDLLANEDNKMAFVLQAINEHKSSDLYKTAVIADAYFRKQNTTIKQYEKMITTIKGQQVIDKYSPNHKVASGFFKKFVTQQVSFLLGNGVTWEKDESNKGFDDNFDSALKKAAKQSLIGAVSFGFWNLDKLDVFKITEFVPLFDENTGALRAGIRWWQIDTNKPLRATLYEEDGYTEYAWNRKENGQKLEGEILKEKQSYIVNVSVSEVDGIEIRDGENYPSFPIVPLWGNEEHESEILGIREGIDEYDLIKNGYANDLDSAQVYWLIKGAGGMDDEDLVKFLDRLKLTHAAAPMDGQDVEAKTVEIPSTARDTLLDRIEKDLYRDYMALNTEDLSSHNATATEIKAAYAPMDEKADDFEYQILDFLKNIMAVAGVENTASFTRSYVVNVQEEVGTVLQAATHLTDEYVTTKVLTLLGDGDKAEQMIEDKEAESIARFNEPTEEETEETEEGEQPAEE